jgi:hypothetical protein
VTTKVVDGSRMTAHSAAELQLLTVLRPCSCADSAAAGAHTGHKAAMLGLQGAVLENVGVAEVAGADGQPQLPPEHHLSVRIRLRNGSQMHLTAPWLQVHLLITGC